MELSNDERFATNPDRVKNREVLIEILGAVFRERSRDEWIAELDRVGVPCGPIQDIEQAFNDPQVKARGLRLSLPDGDEGTLPGVATPISYSATPLRYDRAPPRLGEHTHEVLEQELGLSGADIDALRAAGVLEARDAKP